MISAKSSHERTPRFSPLSYFLFTLRQNWPALVTNTILFLILDVIILSMVLSERHALLTLSDVQSIANDMRTVQVVASSLCAVLWGCSAMRYLNSKVSVQFYHSIPLTRGALYLNEITVKAICFLVPCALGTCLSCILTGILSGFWEASLTAAYFTGFGLSVLYYFLFFGIIFFAASFTGTGFARIMTAGLIVFLPSALILCIYSVLIYSAQYADYSSLTQLALDVFAPARAVFLSSEPTMPGAAREILLTVAAALAFFAAGGWIYRHRKSELSGTPVLSAVAGSIMKYCCMFCAAAVGGMIFHLFMESALWYCIGAVIGMLLCMMLMNTILTKSSKRMFAGIPGLGIFCASFLVFFVLFGVDVVGFDRFIPASDFVRAVRVSVGNTVTMRITDKEEMEELSVLMREYIETAKPETGEEGAAKEYSQTDAEGGETWENRLVDWLQWELLSSRARSVRLSVSFETYAGVPFEKIVYANFSEIPDILHAVVQSGEFADAYFREVDPGTWRSTDTGDAVTWDSDELTMEKTNSILSDMRQEYNGMEYFQRPALKVLRIRERSSGDYRIRNCPVYAADETEWENYLSQVAAVAVADLETGEITVWTKPEEIRAVCENTSLLDEYTSPFTELEEAYSVAIVFSDAEPEDFWAVDSYLEYRIGAFLAGRVPAFVH